MTLRNARFISIGLGALCALPMWAPVAEAAPYIACTARNSQSSTDGLFSHNYEIYSVDCNGEGMRVVAQGRSSPTTNGVEVNMRVETSTTGNAYAFGYDASQNLIPSCVAHDTVPGGSTAWVRDDCGGTTVKFVVIVVNGQ